MVFAKQVVAMWLGLLLVFVHVVTTLLLWIYFGDDKNIYIEELAAPISATYFITIVKWFIGNQGLQIREGDRTFVGLPYFILILFISTMTMGAHVGGAMYYIIDDNATMSVSQLNRFYLLAETTVGGAFALIFSDLYEKKESA